MKQGIHPENYRVVAFKDMSNEQVFLTKSTINTKETIEIHFTNLKFRAHLTPSLPER